MLVVGAEGTMGLVTRAAVRLTPTAPAHRTLLLAFPTATAAGELPRKRPWAESGPPPCKVTAVVAHGMCAGATVLLVVLVVLGQA